MFYGESGAAAGRAVVPIGGVTPFSTLDCPGCISCVFYFQGCPLRCPYCHNTEFQQVLSPAYPLSDFVEFLWPRKDFLDTVVFSGGEPFLFPDALETMTRLAKDKGFEVAIHTSGFNPEALDLYLRKFSVKWVGIDLKAGLKDYPLATGIQRNYFGETAKSIRLLKDAGVDFEVRTTVFPLLMKKNRLDALLKTARNLGVEQMVWQVLCHNGKPDSELSATLKAYIRDRRLEPFVRVR